MSYLSPTCACFKFSAGSYAVIRHCSLACNEFSLPLSIDVCLASTLSLSSCPLPSWLVQQISVYHPLTTHKPQYTKAQYCVSSMCQDFKHISSSSLPLLKSTLKRSCSDMCVYACVCVCVYCKCENICKCVAWLSSQGSASNPPVLTRRAERLSAPLNHWLQRKSLSL